MTRKKKKDGLYHDPKTGRIMEHSGYSTRIYWSTDMLDFLRRHFPTTLNDELAGCIGVSHRTVTRKARELGLVKDAEWMRTITDEHRHLANAVASRMGHPGSIRKGEHRNPVGEFRPGHQLTPEQKAKQSKSIKRWYRTHPIEVKEKARKIWETRRRQ